MGALRVKNAEMVEEGLKYFNLYRTNELQATLHLFVFEIVSKT